jgi:Ca2+/Na+ antiporter
LKSIFLTVFIFYGVTFLAFGNGAPDVFSAIAAVGNAKDGDAGLAFGALFGAGVFVSTVVVGIICFICPFNSVQRPLLRDLIFFMIAGFWAFVVIWGGKIALWETLGFLFLYVVYILVVVLGRYVNQKIKLSSGGTNAVLKNDFSSSSVNRANGRTSGNAQNNNEEEDRAVNEYEEHETLRQPLLTKITHQEDDEVIFSRQHALKDTFIPLDTHEWKESNLFFKILIMVKVL